MTTSSSSTAPLSAPSTPTLLSASHDSLTLSFNLPTQGTPPVLHIIINITSPSHMQWECQGVQSRMLGEELDCTVPRLSSATQYTLAVYGLGYAGRGNASHEVTFTTSELVTSSSPSSSTHHHSNSELDNKNDHSLTLISPLRLSYLFPLYFLHHTLSYSKPYTDPPKHTFKTYHFSFLFLPPSFPLTNHATLIVYILLLFPHPSSFIIY